MPTWFLTSGPSWFDSMYSTVLRLRMRVSPYLPLLTSMEKDANEFKTGPAFAANPIGEPFDPEALAKRLAQGKPVNDLIFRSVRCTNKVALDAHMVTKGIKEIVPKLEPILAEPVSQIFLDGRTGV
jgi:hypothetical protein